MGLDSLAERHDALEGRRRFTRGRDEDTIGEVHCLSQVSDRTLAQLRSVDAVVTDSSDPGAGSVAFTFATERSSTSDVLRQAATPHVCAPR